MKVAYLLVTSAWLLGAQPPAATEGGPKVDGPPPTAKVTAAPVTISGDSCGCNSGCGNYCDSGCGGFWSRCGDWFGKLFHRNDCCDTCGSCGGCQSHTYSCAPTCNTCAPTCNTCAPVCKTYVPTCNTCAPTCNTCAPTCNSCYRSCTTSCSSCNSCDSGCGGGFLSGCSQFFGKLFHRNECCDSCYSGCGSAPYTTVSPPKGGETIPPPKEESPKKMPGGPPKVGAEQVNINNQGIPAPVPAPQLDTAPAAPPIAPARPGDDRPF